MKARLIIAWVLGLTLVPVAALADQTPADPADSFLFYSRRGEPTGDQTDAMIQPDLFTGSASTSIPILVPRGTGGMQPSLGIQYSSKGGRGNAGHGWSIGLSKITRSTRYGADKAQLSAPLDAVYELDGDELLQGGAETDPFSCSATRYHREVETFEKILFCASGDYWVVMSRQGTVHTYGKRAGAQSKLSSGGTTFEYYLDEVIDTHGLSWAADYYGYGEGAANAAPRLKRLHYTYKDGQPVGDLREVELYWKPSPVGAHGVHFRYGFPVAEKKLLDFVEVRLGGSRVRRYMLDHDDGSQTPLSPESEAPLLYSIQMLGVTDTDVLPAQTFTYQQNHWDNQGWFSTAGIPVEAASRVQDGEGNILEDFVDINGDGYKDHVNATYASGGSWLIKFGHGLNGLDSNYTAWNAPDDLRIRETSEWYLDPPDVMSDLVDMDNDGLPDVYTKHATGVWFRNTGSGFQEIQWTIPDPTIFAGRVRDYDRQSGFGVTTTTTVADLVDGNGDGCPDKFSIHNGIWYVRFNRMCDRDAPTPAFANPVPWDFGGMPVPASLGETVSANGTSDTTAGFLDFNSDGLVDFYEHGVVYMGTGRGFRPESDTSFAADMTSIGVDYISRSVKSGLHESIMDVNGDGRPDLVKSNADLGFYICLEDPGSRCNCQHTTGTDWIVRVNTGRGFRTDPISWEAFDAGFGNKPFGWIQSSGYNPCGVGYLESSVLDFDADGIPDVLKDGDELFRGTPIKGELLVKVENGVGGETAITWGAEVGGNPDWSGGGLTLEKGNLHFPVDVVTRIEVTDGMRATPEGPGYANGRVTTDFEYWDSYYDRARRKFRGFGTVEATRSDNVGTAPNYSRTVFATGDDQRSLNLPVTETSTESWQDDWQYAGRSIATLSGPSRLSILTESWTEWMTVPQSAGSRWVIPATTLSIERDGAGNSKWSAAGTMAFDAYGNITETVDFGEYDATGALPDYTAGNDEVYAVTTFAQDVTSWILNLPASVNRYAEAAHSTLLGAAETHYDNQPLGAVTVGDVTKQRTLVEEPSTWAETTYVVDVYGNTVSTTDPVNATKTFTYHDENAGTPDAFAFLYRTDQPVSLGPGPDVTLTTRVLWDERFDTPVEHIDANGRRFVLTRDGLGRVTKVESTPPDDPLGALVTLETLVYRLAGTSATDTENWIYRVKYADASTTLEEQVYLDGLLRPLATVTKADADTPGWIARNTRFTHHGVDRETLPYFVSVLDFPLFAFWDTVPAEPVKVSELDWAGRVVESYLAADDGSTHYTTTRDYFPWKQQVTDARGNGKAFYQDSAGRTIQVDEYDGPSVAATTTYSYDRVGNLTGVVDDAGNPTTITYDLVGQKRSMVDPDMSNCPVPANCPWTYEYDLAGQLTAQTDSKGQRIEFHFDELGRQYLKDYICSSCSEVDVTSTYDTGTNGLGRLYKVEKGAGNSTEFTYDNWGRTIVASTTVFGSPQPTSTTYDWADRILTLTYPTSEVATYTYGAGGGPKTVSFDSQPIITDIQRDALGRALELHWGNGLQTLSGHGPNEKLHSIMVATGQLETRMRQIYEYDAVGNTEKITETHSGWHRDYQYDWADRLTYAAHVVASVTEKDWTYDYDTIGNMTLNSELGDGSYSYVSAGPHAVTDVGGPSFGYTLQYDETGNLELESDLSGPVAAYTYNFDGRMATANDYVQPTDPNVAFTYGGAGGRVRKTWTEGAVSKELRYFGSHYEQLIEDSTQYDERYVMLGDTRVAHISSKVPGEVRFLHPDVQGTVGVITDEQGVTIQERIFAPYGELYQNTGIETGVRYGYTGQEHDAEVALIHLGVRQLHPAVARFPQPDTIVPDPLHPQTLNRYAYALNNPLRYTDPSGYTPPEATSANCDEEQLASCGPPPQTPLGRFVHKLVSRVLREKLTKAHGLSARDRQLLGSDAVDYGDFKTEGQLRNDDAKQLADVGGYVAGYYAEEAAFGALSKGASKMELAFPKPKRGASGAIRSALGKLFGKKSGGSRRLWRTVSPEELADIVDTGVLRMAPHGNSMEGKWFWDEAASAQAFGHDPGGLGLYPNGFHVVEVEVSNDLAEGAFRISNLDDIGDARYIESHNLNEVMVVGYH